MTAPTQAARADETLAPLVNHPLLGKLSTRNQRVLAATGEPFAVESAMLAHEGDPARTLFLIQSGFVELTTIDRRGRRVLVQTIGPGEIVGWSWMVPPYLWQFEVRAAGRVCGVQYDAEWLRDRCEQDRDLGYELLRYMYGILADRLSATRRTHAGWL
jgi:CRP-like cAMP-binding protein